MAHSSDSFKPIYLGKLSFDMDELEFFNQTAKNSGLTSDYLLIACSWIESKEIDEKHKLKLIECLIPTPNGGTIPVEVCIRLTYLLKTSQTPIATKIEILKWMICAHSFMETNDRFQMLYEIFFMLLKNEEMRPYIAHFLCLITQKKHVTFSRAKRLLRHVDEYGPIPSFTMLLRTFSLHVPDYFDEEYDEECEGEFESLSPYPNLIKNVHRAYSPNFSNILITSMENNSTAVLTDLDSVDEKMSEQSFSKITTFDQLYKQFRALERCTDISKILKSDLRRFFFTSRLDTKMKTKLQDYITAILQNSFESEDIVERHLDLFRFQHCFPYVLEFTEILLMKEKWSPDFLEVMCFQPICCFKKIQPKLQDIQRKFFSTEDVQIKCQWLNSLSKMFCYWILQSRKPVPCDGICNKDDSDAESDTPLFHIPSREISQLGSEIDYLCDSLIIEDGSPFVLSQILQHYQMGTLACQQMEKSSLCFPSPSAFQLSLFSLTPFLLETLSGLMLRIHAIYDSKKDTEENEEFVIFQAAVNDVKKVLLGGSYKRDNTYLAKTKAFKKLIGREADFKGAFILHKHPALLFTAMEFCEENNLEYFPNDPENKQKFFLYLAEKGYKNFGKFISKIK